MTARIDILEEREQLGRPLLASVALHAAIFAAAVLSGAVGEHARVLWGDPRALGGGGAYAITPVRQIPLPSRGGLVNPLANDTQSNVPRPPEPKPVPKAPEPDPEAIALKSRQAKKTSPPRRMARAQQQPSRLPPRDAPNQLYSEVGQALSSRMFGGQMGSGGVGVGPGSAFGYRFGWYQQLLQERIAQKWRTDEVDPRLRNATVIVTFDILRNGQIRNVSVLQSGGNRTLDYSAERAVYEAAPFPPLPAGYERDAARIEIWFQLKR